MLTKPLQTCAESHEKLIFLQKYNFSIAEALSYVELCVLGNFDNFWCSFTAQNHEIRGARFLIFSQFRWLVTNYKMKFWAKQLWFVIKKNFYF